jgi:fructoselysine-6-P-deglycase FrlB-like protein
VVRNKYIDELDLLPDALTWASEVELGALPAALERLADLQLLACGSGGSYSGATFLAQAHRHYQRRLASAISPLLLMQQPHLAGTGVCFLSAGGNNKDVLSAWETVAACDYANLIGLVMKQGSRLAERAGECGGVVSEFVTPWGGDGFLATRTLVSTCALLLRSYATITRAPQPTITGQSLRELPVLRDVVQRPDVLVMAGAWGWPAATDMESKCSEAALARTLVSDFRSFGHGRHVWLAKRSETSAVVAFATPTEAQLARRTLALLPNNVPRALVLAEQDGPAGMLELLVKGMFVTGEFAKTVPWDAAHPQVPEFGRKLYGLGPMGIRPRTAQNAVTTWLRRKAAVMGLSEESAVSLEVHLRAFLERLRTTQFDALVLDYDGTLCEPHERYVGLRAEVKRELQRLLRDGVAMAVATGRGDSVTKELREAIPPELHQRLRVGYYNGACILPLDADLPDMVTPEPLARAAEVLAHVPLGEFRLKPWQVTIRPHMGDVAALERTVRLLVRDIPRLKVRRSRHSVDVSLEEYTKLNVMQMFGTNAAVLAIGDSGAPGGNDEDLLLTPFALSTCEPSADPSSGWHVAPPGQHFSRAAATYLQRLHVGSDAKVTFDIDSLVRT